MLSMNLSVIVSDSLVEYRCFSNGLQRYAVFYYLQTFFDFFFKNFTINHFTHRNFSFFTQIFLLRPTIPTTTKFLNIDKQTVHKH